MDPDEALGRMREIVAEFDRSDDTARAGDCEELVDLVRGVDDWMSRGGFAPTAWTRDRQDKR